MFTLQQLLLARVGRCFASYPRLYWIVGGSCTGKSTVCHTIAAVQGIKTIDMDTLVYGTFGARYTAARHPASTAWFRAPNPFDWVMGLTWPEFSALTMAVDVEALDLFTEELTHTDPAEPLLVDGGVAHPDILARVLPSSHIACMSVDDETRRRCWESDPARTDIHTWFSHFTDPDAMWSKFLRHDRLLARAIDAECARWSIPRIQRHEDESIQSTTARVTAALRLE